MGFDVAVHLPVDYDRYTLTPALAPRADELQAHVQTDAVVNAARMPVIVAIRKPLQSILALMPSAERTV